MIVQNTQNEDKNLIFGQCMHRRNLVNLTLGWWPEGGGEGAIETRMLRTLICMGIKLGR